MNHVQALLRLLSEHASLVKDELAVALAIWFHDAIYDSTRDDNEAQSALLVEQTLTAWGCSAALTESVARKVRATQGHVWVDGDPDTAAFLDFDLGILAAPEAIYQRYADQVAQEYAWVPEPAYRVGRAKVLRSFLDRPSLYFTPALRAQWESVARANLARELASLA
jgi:predicted metal-dependent HD superfamily phosphohydrolase